MVRGDGVLSQLQVQDACCFSGFIARGILRDNDKIGGGRGESPLHLSIYALTQVTQHIMFQCLGLVPVLELPSIETLLRGSADQILPGFLLGHSLH